MREVSEFTLYNGADQPRCVHRVSGLLTVHLLGLGELLRCSVSQGPGSVVPCHGSITPPSLAPGSTAPAPCRPEASKEVFCAIQVDGVTRARTSLLTCRGPALPLNHTFHLELERAKLLRLVVLSPHTPSTNQGQGQGQTRNRVCGLGAISIPPLFKGRQEVCVCVCCYSFGSTAEACIAEDGLSDSKNSSRTLLPEMTDNHSLFSPPLCSSPSSSPPLLSSPQRVVPSSCVCVWSPGACCM